MDDRRFVEYHSKAWDQLVEQGWLTWSVDRLPNGTEIACMVPADYHWSRRIW
jgi:hypothetical protein